MFNVYRPFKDGPAEGSSEIGEVEGLAEGEDARSRRWIDFWRMMLVRYLLARVEKEREAAYAYVQM